MKRIFLFFVKKRVFAILVVGALCASFFVVLLHPVFAQDTASTISKVSTSSGWCSGPIGSRLCDGVLGILSIVIAFFTSLVSLLFTAALSLLIRIGSYDGFGNSAAVTLG